MSSSDETKHPLSKLTEKTWVPLGATLAIVLAVATATYKVTTLLTGISDKIEELGKDRWTGRDMQDYATRMEKSNRAISRTDGVMGLMVPDPREVHRANSDGR